MPEPQLILTTLQRYILRETLRVAAFAIIALTGMICIGLAIELIRSGLSVVQLRDLLPFVFAHSLPYALPSSFLVAAVFVFGRLSGNNELSAIRAGGINLNHIIVPIIALGIIISISTFGLNHYLLPWSHNRITQLKESVVKTAIKHVGTTHTKFELGDYLIYVGGVDKDGRWKNCALVKFANEYPSLILLADQGHCSVNEETGAADIRLYNGNLFQPQLNEGIGEPLFAFKETQYRLDLTESRVPPTDIAPEDIALIKQCVHLALEHATLTSQRQAIANNLIFYQHTNETGEWVNPGLVQFNDAELPMRVILADTGHYTLDPKTSQASLRLRHAREFTVSDSALANKPTPLPEETTLIIKPDARVRVPQAGTNPLAFWFSTRPKYFTLPDLLDLRRARLARAQQLLAKPQYRNVKHPSSERRILERDEGTLYRKYAACLADIKPETAAAKKAADAITQAHKQMQALSSQDTNLAEKAREAAENIEKHQPHMEQYLKDIERLEAEKAPAERIEERRKRAKLIQAQLAGFNARAKQINQARQSITEKLSNLKQLLSEQEHELKAAETRVAAQRKKADAAKTEYNILRQQAHDIKLIEKHLRAETEFHYRNAGAATTLLFLIIGIPLGVLSRKGNVILAFALSFFTVLIIYYPLMMLGEMFSRDGFMAPWAAQWMANVVIGAIGLTLMKWGVKR